jgi:hypothetical protein
MAIKRLSERVETLCSLALRLSDTQLDEIMRLCQPLALHCRDACPCFRYCAVLKKAAKGLK